MVSNISSVVLTTSVVAVVTTVFFFYVVRKRRQQNKIPKEWKKVGIAKKLYIFPLKSGHYMEIDAAECTKVGLRLLRNHENPLELRDRSFMVYGEKDSEIKSGRTLPQLVLIGVSVHDANNIRLDAPEMETLYVKVPEKSNSYVTTVKTWNGVKVKTVDCGDEAARWLSRYIFQKDNGYRLGYHDASKYAEHFFDDASVMIVNQASINDYMKRAPNANVSALNFRANIIVDDPDMRPYEEYDWKWMKIGEEVVMRYIKDCTRCTFTNVDPETGVRNADKEPLTTLSQYRSSKDSNNKPRMGIDLEVAKTGIIKNGDPVYVGIN